MYSSKNTLFVSSPGGHLVEAIEIATLLRLQASTFVVSNNQDLHFANINTVLAPQADRNIGVFKQFYFAFFYIAKNKPKLIISTGAGIAVPFFIFSKLFSCKTIYIETPTAIYNPTLTCRILQYFADRLYVRTPFLLDKIKNSIFLE
jgi:UDP-N-acetylglucosamine:LPS N-acetylglucosamine transferase